jgi:hypothetical protein
MDATYSDLWVQAIKEVLAEEGKPPMSAEDEKQVRVDVEQMNAAREISLQKPERLSV